MENGRVSIRSDLPEPAAGEGEAKLRVHLAGICGTDLELLRGYADFEGIPGHEFVATVEEGPPEWLGARVVAEINVTCADEDPGRCPSCAAGRSSHCRRRDVIGIRGRAGAFAEHIAVPLRNLHRLPHDIPDEVGVFAEPLAAALRIAEQLDIGADDRVLVVGPGRLGLLVARTLALRTSRVEVAGRSGTSLDRATSGGIRPRLMRDVPDGSYDAVVECTGKPDGFRAARAAVRPAGTIVVKSTYDNDLQIDISSVVVDEISIVGSRCGPFGAALDVLRAGTVTVEDLIDDRLPLDRAPDAFERAAEPGVAKVLLEPA